MCLRNFQGSGVHHGCSVLRKRICVHWHGNAVGTWAIEKRRDQACCITTLGTTGSVGSRHSDDNLANITQMATLAAKIGLTKRNTDPMMSEISHDWIRTSMIAALSHGVSESEGDRCASSKSGRGCQRPAGKIPVKLSIKNVTNFQRTPAVKCVATCADAWHDGGCATLQARGCAVEFDNYEQGFSIELHCT